MLTMAMFA